jgi:hypothetical protein
MRSRCASTPLLPAGARPPHPFPAPGLQVRSHLTLGEFELVGAEEKAEAHVLWQGVHLTDFATASAAAVVNQACLMPPSHVPPCHQPRAPMPPAACHQACH